MSRKPRVDRSREEKWQIIQPCWEARVTLTTDNGTQFTSTRFIATLHRLGITHRRTAYNHPEGNSYIERFHRRLKEEEAWTSEYRDVQEARASIARWIQEYNHDRPHRGVQNRTPQTRPS
jgi:putative transposase